MNQKSVEVGGRWAYIEISIGLVIEIMTEGWSVLEKDVLRLECTEGLPSGATYIRQFYDARRDTVCLVFYHPSFVFIHRGMEIPRIPVDYMREIQIRRVENGSTP
jgi:hypothetical protein